MTYQLRSHQNFSNRFGSDKINRREIRLETNRPLWQERKTHYKSSLLTENFI